MGYDRNAAGLNLVSFVRCGLLPTSAITVIPVRNPELLEGS